MVGGDTFQFSIDYNFAGSNLTCFQFISHHHMQCKNYNAPFHFHFDLPTLIVIGMHFIRVRVNTNDEWVVVNSPYSICTLHTYIHVASIVVEYYLGSTYYICFSIP